MRVAVIGSGISGIAAAFYLAKRQVRVDLFESEKQIGGRVGSDLLQGRWVDFGGKNIGNYYNHFREFAKTYGNLEYEYFGINTSQLLNGRLISISREGYPLLNIFKLVQLCGLQGIIRLYPHIKAIWNDRSQGVLGSDCFKSLSDQFDHLTLDQYLNRQCIDNVIRPITVRMNGAEPEECYPGNFGSNLGLALDSFEQLSIGMHDLLNTFANNYESDSHRILTGHHITAITKDRETFRIDYLHQGIPGTGNYDKVISALPAHSLATLLQNERPEVAELLRQISYYPVSVAIVKYSDDVFQKKRRAMVFGRNLPLSNAGAYGLNDLDMVRYTFSGKASRAAITEKTSPEEAIELAEKLASPYFNIQNNKKEGFVYRYFSKGLCAYSSRHHLLLEKIDKYISSFTGFGYTGDYRRGASIEACFRAAHECVETVIGN